MNRQGWTGSSPRCSRPRLRSRPPQQRVWEGVQPAHGGGTRRAPPGTLARGFAGIVYLEFRLAGHGSRELEGDQVGSTRPPEGPGSGPTAQRAAAPGRVYSARRLVDPGGEAGASKAGGAAPGDARTSWPGPAASSGLRGGCNASSAAADNRSSRLACGRRKRSRTGRRSPPGGLEQPGKARPAAAPRPSARPAGWGGALAAPRPAVRRLPRGVDPGGADPGPRGRPIPRPVGGRPGRLARDLHVQRLRQRRRARAVRAAW